MKRDKQVFMDAASALYASDDIQVDGDAELSEADDGAWVQAWVWVSDSDAEQT